MNRNKNLFLVLMLKNPNEQRMVGTGYTRSANMRHHEEKINLYEAPTNSKIMEIHLIYLIKDT